MVVLFSSSKLEVKSMILYVIFVLFVCSGEGLLGTITTYHSRDMETAIVDKVMLLEYNSFYPTDPLKPLPYVAFSATSIYTLFYAMYGTAIMTPA